MLLFSFITKIYSYIPSLRRIDFGIEFLFTMIEIVFPFTYSSERK